VNNVTIEKRTKATKELICFCVSGKGQSYTAPTFDEYMGTIIPLPTIKPRYSVSRLAQKHSTILIINLLSHKADINF